MAAIESEDLFPEARNPEGTRIINERCLVKTQEGHCVIMVSGIILAQYALGDRMSEALAMVSLIEQRWADQNDIARTFGYSARTVRRHQQRFQDGGLAALGRGSGYPKGRSRLRGARTRLIHRLKTEGHANREIARRVGVSEMAVRKLLRPLEACRGGFSLSGIEVQSTQMEEDVGLEALFVPIAKGLFDQTLDLIVEALNGTIG